MSHDNVLSRRQVRKKNRKEGKSTYYKKEPLYLRFLYVIIDMMVQVIIFSLFYTAFIQSIRTSNNTGIEFLFVFLLIIGTDILCFFIISSVRILINNFKEYIKREKRKRGNFNRRTIEYIFYTFLRTIFYLIGFTQSLSTALYPYMTFLWGFLAYFLAWLIVSLLSRAISLLTSIYITKSV